MLLAKALQAISKRYCDINSARRELQTISGEATRAAKQAIFALQREDQSRARALLKQALGLLIQGQRCVTREPRLATEGMWRAALEETCEAVLCDRVVSNVSLLPVPAVIHEPEILIGGIADLVGEMVRLAIRAATHGESARVTHLHALAEQLVEWLTSMDIIGPLRAKGDQARQHLRKLEDIRYDLAQRAR